MVSPAEFPSAAIFHTSKTVVRHKKIAAVRKLPGRRSMFMFVLTLAALTNKHALELARQSRFAPD